MTLKALALKTLSVLALLFLASSPIRAQTHPCGSGPGPDEVQVGEAPGGNGVAPMPMCDWVNNGSSQAPQPPPERWADRWGAIATYPSGGVLGVAANMASKEEATKAALADCQAKGGGSKCKVERWYNNQCAAFTVSDKGFNSQAALTIDAAVKEGMEICTQSGQLHCRTYYTACSLPIRLQ